MWETKQIIRKVESRVSNGKAAGGEIAGCIAAESESPARIGVGQTVLLDPPHLAPHSDVVLAHVAKKNIHSPDGLITREGGYGIVQCSEVRKLNGRQAPVQGICRNTLNSQVTGDVFLVCEGIEKGSPLAIEIYGKGIDRTRAEGVNLRKVHVLAPDRTGRGQGGESRYRCAP